MSLYICDLIVRNNFRSSLSLNAKLMLKIFAIQVFFNTKVVCIGLYDYLGFKSPSCLLQDPLNLQFDAVCSVTCKSRSWFLLPLIETWPT
jgi:hypothetical protein